MLIANGALAYARSMADSKAFTISHQLSAICEVVHGIDDN